MLLKRFFLFYLYLNFIDEAFCKNEIMSQFLKFTENVLDQANNLVRQFKVHNPGPIDCAEIMRRGETSSGVYRIWPLAWEKFGSLSVLCDMDTDGGGWTVIQKRGQYRNPSNYFNKTWQDYKLGFGDLNKEFWIGNDQIFALTNQGNYSLRIDMKDLEGEKRFALYKVFWIENEDHDYKIHISSYSGNAGNSLTYSNGLHFITTENNRRSSNLNCIFQCGGWWLFDHSSLTVKGFYSNLNGLNLNGANQTYSNGIIWISWKDIRYSLPDVNMKIRPVNFK